MIASYLIGAGTGTYLDIGAGNPVVGSNTFRFYKEGWRGIGVDANSNLAQAWKLVRPGDKFIHAAVNATQKPVLFYEFENDLKSTTVSHVRDHYLQQGKGVVQSQVESLTLNELLPTNLLSFENFFLSIDVEGAELDVLASADLMVKRPKLVGVESWTLPWEDQNEVTSFLKSKQYGLACYSGLTAFYLPEENLQILKKSRFIPR